MTLFERIEKKIFFRIVRVVTLFFALVAFIAIIAGLYTTISTSSSEEAKSVEVQKDEIDEVLKPEPKQTDTQKNDQENANENEEKTEAKKLAESIAKKLLALDNITAKAPDYNTQLGSSVDQILGLTSNYDDETQVSALKQLDELSNSFSKATFVDEANVFLKLFASKYAHEQAIATQKNAAAEANRLVAVSIIGGGVVTFALFVIILVLLRIEKNTRPIDSQNDEYDSTDKKLLLGIVGIGILLSFLIGYGYNDLVSGEDEFDPVADLKASFVSSTANSNEAPVAEASTVSDAAAPAAEPAADENWDSTAQDIQDQAAPAY